jgi:perosamine synthetase
MKIPIAKPYISKDEIQSVVDVLKSGKIAQGTVVAEFEEIFADYTESGHAIACVNGTAALHASMIAAGVKPGDEVIVPSFSFISTATSVNMCGAKPVFADVNPTTFTIEPTHVEDLITEKTRAVVGVHLFGCPFESSPIHSLCKKNDIVMIEDAAQAVGSKEYHKMCGNIGDFATFSFYATKNITCGEGGMITTNDDDYAKLIRKIINHGQSEKYKHDIIGYNYRMTDILATIALHQMNRIEDVVWKRNKIAGMYKTGIDDSHNFGFQENRANCRSSYHQFAVVCQNRTEREKLMNHLDGCGVGTAIHYPTPIHAQPVYMDDAVCPVSENLSDCIMSIPIYPSLTKEEINYVIDSINGGFK